MNKVEKIVYTIRRRSAFLKVEKKVLGKNTWHGRMHDMDLLMRYFLFFWQSSKRIFNRHVANNPHHVLSRVKKSERDMLDTLIRWEAKRLVYPDAPNAYEELSSRSPGQINLYLPVLKKYFPEQVKEKTEQ